MRQSRVPQILYLFSRSFQVEQGLTRLKSCLSQSLAGSSWAKHFNGLKVDILASLFISTFKMYSKITKIFNNGVESLVCPEIRSPTGFL